MADSFISCRVSATTKEALRAAAERQHLSESALVKRLIEMMLHAAAPPEVSAVPPSSRQARDTRLYVRLSSGDWALLRERAAARSVPAATYASNLIRAHVRGVSPLLKEELLALRRAIAMLGTLGNNFNQMVRMSHQSGQAMGPSRESLMAMIKVCETLRDHIRGLIKANVLSWQSGDAPHH